MTALIYSFHVSKITVHILLQLRLNPMAELHLLDKVVGKNLLVSLQRESNLHGVNSNHDSIHFPRHDSIHFPRKHLLFESNYQNKTKHRFPLP